MNYSYSSFSGDEVGTSSLDADEILTVDYQAEVEEGTLSIRVEDPDGEVLQSNTMQQDDSGTWTVTAPEEGDYHIVVEGDDASGSFDVEWDPASDEIGWFLYLTIGVVAAVLLLSGVILFLIWRGRRKRLESV
jgi:hypothetical protein